MKHGDRYLDAGQDDKTGRWTGMLMVLAPPQDPLPVLPTDRDFETREEALAAIRKQMESMGLRFDEKGHQID